MSINLSISLGMIRSSFGVFWKSSGWPTLQIRTQRNFQHKTLTIGKEPSVDGKKRWMRSVERYPA